jgi:hypothetical protein
MSQEQEPLATNEAGQEQEPLTTDETGSSNLNLLQKFDISPEYVRGFPKAGKRKNERKGRRKGKSIVATSTPEMKSIVQKKNNSNKTSPVKKSIFAKEKEEV